jgi:hypothetical protein
MWISQIFNFLLRFFPSSFTLNSITKWTASRMLKQNWNYFNFVPFSASPLAKKLHLSSTINKTNDTGTYTRFQISNIEHLKVNGKRFTVIRKRNIPKEKLEKIQNILRIIRPSDINAQVGNHNWEPALHFAFKINDYKTVTFLLTQGTEIFIIMVIWKSL